MSRNRHFDREKKILATFSSFLCKHPTILFQSKNRIFQHKNQTIN